MNINDAGSGFDPYHPYDNCDPRLRFSVFVVGDVLPSGIAFKPAPTVELLTPLRVPILLQLPAITLKNISIPMIMPTPKTAASTLSYCVTLR
ncbi:hypothetical protein [Mucilaginibacter sp. SP1R1]|uniref:hypothetical protein n=1 Tax=Mucilaginibacter sp. SP1R1 TaxID=2723091 RepID=UPI00182A3297|nr:hypothetical protein [Mucilaginibacter sp. SP1R1]MBB6148398.1 hypothetical protein [Mucilaginibacter sp. SP1R1]